jgi:hypothetical protein
MCLIRAKKFSSGEWIRTTDHKVMSVNPETEEMIGNITPGFFAKILVFSVFESVMSDLSQGVAKITANILEFFHNKYLYIPKTYRNG